MIETQKETDCSLEQLGVQERKLFFTLFQKDAWERQNIKGIIYALINDAFY